MLLEITDHPDTNYIDTNNKVVKQSQTGEIIVRASFYDNGKENLYVQGFDPEASLKDVITTMRKTHDNNTNTN